MTRELLSCLAILLLVMYNLRRGLGLAYPPVLFGLIWLFAIGMNLVVRWSGAYPVWAVHHHLLLLFPLGVLMYTLGGRLALNGVSSASSDVSGDLDKDILQVPAWLESVFLGLCVCAVPLFIWRASHLVMASPWFYDQPFRALRWVISYGGQDYGMLAYLYPVAVMSVLLCYWRSQRLGWSIDAVSRIALAIAATLCLTVLLTGRTYPLLLVLVCLGWTLPASRSIWKKLVAGGFVFLLLFAAVGIALKKVSMVNVAPGVGPSGVLGSISWYTVGGMHALGQHL